MMKTVFPLIPTWLLSAWSLPAWTLIVAPLFAMAILGCASSPKIVADKDSKLIRFVESGQEAFAEGDVDDALKEYRRAILRAWAMDDPYEAGTAAYNMAACLFSRGRCDEASNWLVDSRVDLGRARSSTGNAWLLSAEIAVAQENFEDADRFIGYASQACYPCDLVDDKEGLASCLDPACKESCLYRIPILGNKLRKKKRAEDCRLAYEANIELAKARLAAKELDLCTAKNHYQQATLLSQDVCDLSLKADQHDAAALIFDLESNHLQSAAHRDRETVLLRSIAQYREIPNVLDSAANSYCLAGRFDLAIDRMIRSARIFLARGEFEQSWNRIRAAGELAESEGCVASDVRLALTAKFLEDAISAKNKSSSTAASESNSVVN